MKYITTLVLLLLISMMLTGCLFTHVRTPYDTDLDRTQLGPMQGEADMRSVLWLVAWGDASTAAAARNGGLTTINHMDMEILSILWGLYTVNTTIVYGE